MLSILNILFKAFSRVPLGRLFGSVPTADAWIWREWFDVAPGGEAVDMEDLAVEFGSGAGKEVWLSRAGQEAG